MKLYTFAHYAEAKSVIEYFSLHRDANQDWIFTHSDFILILTGEGPHASLARVSFILGKFNEISEIINFGIAGSLHHELKVGEIYSIRHVFAYFDSPLYHSYRLQNDGFDLVTTQDRILKTDQLPPLKTMAKIIDRELWGIAKASYDFDIPLRAFKFISDIAGTLGACELVKEKAPHISDQLKQALLEMKDSEKKVKQIEEDFPDGLYLTLSQERQFKELKRKLLFYYSESEIHDFLKTQIGKLVEDVKLPKARTKILIDLMREKLCPDEKVFTHV